MQGRLGVIFGFIVTLQGFGAVLASIASLVAITRAALSWRLLADFLTSKLVLIQQRNAAIRQSSESLRHVEEARQTVALLDASLDAVRKDSADNRERIERLEKARPMYDALLVWAPRAIEYIIWIETLAKGHGLDLGGREMPELPEAIRQHFKDLSDDA